MLERASALTKAENRLSVAKLECYAQDWLLDCQLRQHSAQTVYCRKDYLSKLFWFLKKEGIEAVGTTELKQFMLYLSKGHEEPGGRWGNPRMTEPMRPVSIHAYHRVLRAMFNWLENDEAIDFNPMKRVKPPVYRSEAKQPLSPERVTALLQAAKRSQHGKRDQAIVMALLDSGIRASELCRLKIADLDLAGQSFKVYGKGNKRRSCYLGRATTKAISAYLRTSAREPDEPVFVGGRDTRAKTALTPSGLFQLLDRLAKNAGIPHGICSPHALRRTFAVSLLRNGASVFATQNLLGHTDLQQTRLYCAVAQADVENQHRQFSPVDALAKKRG